MYYPDDKVALFDEYFTKLKCTALLPALAADCSAQWLHWRNVLTQVNSELTHKNIINSLQIPHETLYLTLSLFPTSIMSLAPRFYL